MIKLNLINNLLKFFILCNTTAVLQKMIYLMEIRCLKSQIDLTKNRVDLTKKIRLSENRDVTLIL